jgi:hypothetical protein
MCNYVGITFRNVRNRLVLTKLRENMIFFIIILLVKTWKLQDYFDIMIVSKYI